MLDDTSLDINSVTYRTDVEGLFFIPAGKWHEHSPEFFAGTRMPQIIEALSRRVGNGVIILDSPPLLATNETQAATRFVGQVLLVVRADDTEQQAVQDAIALVEKSTPISAVLNRVQASALSRYHGRVPHYGYGYGRGQRPGEGGCMNISIGARPRWQVRPDGLSWLRRQSRWPLRPSCSRTSTDDPVPVIGTSNRCTGLGQRTLPRGGVHSGRESRRRSSTSTTSIPPRKARTRSTPGASNRPRAHAAYLSKLGDRSDRLFSDRPRLGRQ